MDEVLWLILLLCGGALFFLPLFLHLWHLRATRQLRATIEKLAARVSALEHAKPPTVNVPPPIPAPASAHAPQPGIATPPPLPTAHETSRAVPVDWESAIGVKLFAWLGGLVLFIGLAFAIKYAFQYNLITPAMRVIGGAVIGGGLIAGGMLSAARRYHAPAFSLCATGVLVLYTATYAAHAFYQLIPLTVATGLMIVVTAAAFGLALRLDAAVIVVLGVLGGFLTPPLLWTGGNQPVALFGYAAMLNFGVAGVAIRKNWNFLVLLAAIATAATELWWLAEFFSASAAFGARWICVLFLAQFIAIALVRQKSAPPEPWTGAAAAIAGLAGFIAAFSFVYARDVAVHSGSMVLPFVFLCDAGLLLLVASQHFGHGAPRRHWIAAGALLFTWMVEAAWHDERFTPAAGALALLWYLAIFALFMAYPFVSEREERWPWTIAAAAGLAQFWMAYIVAEVAVPVLAGGALPALFSLPYFLGIWFLLKRRAIDLPSMDQRMASQSAAALFFLSLIVALQLEREWITLGWAMGGLALLVLYRRIPNPLVRWTAIILLCGAFVRLAFNPAVWNYHPRTGIAIWNWYLYAYGVTAACQIAGGWLLGRNFPYASRLLYGLGTATAFLLLNIEIADYFSVGPTLTFTFSGDFARDMTYSIAWAVFAFGLLLIGMRTRARLVRYAGVALIMATLLKLFLHDLDNLSQLYRIGAFIGVAVVLIVASFLYQRFLSARPRV